MPLGAALAGRVLGAWILIARARRLRLTPILSVVLAGYLLSLGYAVAQPPTIDTHPALARWLAGHDLTDGLSGYWDANITTLISRGGVHVSCVWGSGGLAPCTWETTAADYQPGAHRATFYLLAANDRSALASVERVFGPPRRIYHAAGHIIVVWNYNILGRLRPRPP